MRRVNYQFATVGHGRFQFVHRLTGSPQLGVNRHRTGNDTVVRAIDPRRVNPKIVMDTEVRYLEVENLNPSYYMWRVLEPEVETVRRGLARISAATPKQSPSPAMPPKRMRLSSSAWS